MCSYIPSPAPRNPLWPPVEPCGFGSEFCSAAYNLCTEPIAFVLLQIVLRKQVSVWEHAETHRASVVPSIGSMQGYMYTTLRHVSRQIKLVQSCLLSNHHTSASQGGTVFYYVSYRIIVKRPCALPLTCSLENSQVTRELALIALSQVYLLAQWNSYGGRWKWVTILSSVYPS